MKVNKNKSKKKTFTNIMIASGLSFAVVGCGVAYLYNEYQKPQVSKAVSYDDEEYTITLTGSEFFNYHYDNLANYLNNNTISNTSSFNNISSFVYTDGVFEIDADVSFEYNSLDTEDSLTYVYSNETDYIIESQIGLDLGITYNFYYHINVYTSEYDEVDSNIVNDTSFSFEWYIGSTNYSAIKSAIELDIQANQPAQANSIGEEIIETITSGLGLTKELADEFLTGFGTLFWNNGALTNFSMFALIMLGVAVSFAVVKLVLNIIRGNTGA